MWAKRGETLISRDATITIRLPLKQKQEWEALAQIEMRSLSAFIVYHVMAFEAANNPDAAAAQGEMNV